MRSLQLTLQGVSSELESGTIALLGREPWLTVRYGVVGLKGYPLSSAAKRLREFVIEAEHAVSVEETQLIKRWKPGRVSRNHRSDARSSHPAERAQPARGRLVGHARMRVAPPCSAWRRDESRIYSPQRSRMRRSATLNSSSVLAART